MSRIVYSRVDRYVTSGLIRHQDAGDYRQEVLTHLHESDEEWGHRSDRYIGTTAANAIISIHRKRMAGKQGSGRVASLKGSDAPTAVPGPANFEIADVIARCVAKFSPQTREYLQLWPRFTHQKAIDHLGFSRRTGMAINAELEAAKKEI
ncbi:MAG: sigma-70 family RNA polymerase sigma factor [Pyrinomonadaceae bacterium]|nr:sigma-70 family RNA polymerase sigma factor [Phycisphaerales bacterium]